ncbi:HARB1-like protein [Mya arenaria]|uniref:HARB1-like protein n=1 Tax=Mya arenaria TaxID=6604 RepID=A0ABY7ECJ7_MYAAR|nr:HARB1-like protein [Mya arenaria]
MNRESKLMRQLQEWTTQEMHFNLQSSISAALYPEKYKVAALTGEITTTLRDVGNFEHEVERITAEVTQTGTSFLMDRIPNLNQLLESEIIDRCRYLATGPIQLNDGDIHGVSQPTVSPILTEVIEVLFFPTLVRRFIKFPQGKEECERNTLQFRGIARFPKVIGAIDSTHIHVVSPHEQEDIYVNRKGVHSINVQVILDGSYIIIDVVARWPGSVHDSVIVCCVLHNICKQRAIPMAAVADNNDGRNGDDGRPQPQANNLVGLRYRDHFVSSYFAA